MEDLRELVLKIHSTPHKAVLAITGGGTEAIGELLRHGQGSNTLLEAVVPYDQVAFDRFVRGTPDKYCSEGAANDLAMAAYQRGLFLTKQVTPTPPIIGVGVTCSLVKDKEREGREHHAYICVQNDHSTLSFEVNLADKVRSRNEQEALVAKAIIQVLAAKCFIENSQVDNLIHSKISRIPNEFIEVVKGQRDIAPSTFERRKRVIFPGAFNPMHAQHERIAEITAQITGCRIDLEVCIHNVDKPVLSYTEINNRLDHLIEKIRDKVWGGQLFFTSTPTFVQKAATFPESTFVLGWDTFSRICDPKYGSVEEAVNAFKRHKTKFIVFDRLINGQSAREITQHLIHPEIMMISNIIAPKILPPVEMSSSDIRTSK